MFSIGTLNLLFPQRPASNDAQFTYYLETRGLTAAPFPGSTEVRKEEDGSILSTGRAIDHILTKGAMFRGSEVAQASGASDHLLFKVKVCAPS